MRTCRHHFRPPPPQNYRICTPRTRVRRSDPTNSTGYRPKSTGCPYAPGRPRPGHRQWCTGGGAHLSPPLPPASAELSHLHIARTGQAVRPKSTGCPYTRGRPRPGHRHRLPLRGLATPAPTHAQAAPTHLAPLHVPGTAGFCCLSAPMFLPAHCTHHLQSHNLSNVGFGSLDFWQNPFL